MTFLLLKFVHVIGAIVLLGTGAGIAFFMLSAHRSRDVAHIARTAATVVTADCLFTATAVLVQPVTGVLLAQEAGLPLSESWVVWSFALYGIAGVFWLPVVWMQTRMRDLAREAVRNETPLPSAYFRLFRMWFAFGFPGFGATLAIVWIMIAKPNL